MRPALKFTFYQLICYYPPAYSGLEAFSHQPMMLGNPPILFFEIGRVFTELFMKVFLKSNFQVTRQGNLEISGSPYPEISTMQQQKNKTIINKY